MLLGLSRLTPAAGDRRLYRWNIDVLPCRQLLQGGDEGWRQHCRRIHWTMFQALHHAPSFLGMMTSHIHRPPMPTAWRKSIPEGAHFAVIGGHFFSADVYVEREIVTDRRYFSLYPNNKPKISIYFPLIKILLRHVYIQKL